MNEYDVSELAYKNGYKKGYEEAMRNIAERLKDKYTQAIYPNFIYLSECELKSLVEELLGKIR